MYCPKCGTENPDEAQACRSCGVPLSPPPVPSTGIVLRRSRLAIAAFVLGVASIAVFPVGLIAIILGIAGIIAIEKSGGRLTGRVFAMLGVLIPVFVFCLIFVLVGLYRALWQVNRQTRSVTCLAALKQWSVCFSMYSDDNDGNFFPRQTDQSRCWWTDPLARYWRDNKRFLFCPEATKPYKEGGRASFAAWSIGNQLGSYGLNEWICNPGQDDATLNPAVVRENFWGTPKIEGASRIPLLLDAAWFMGRPMHTDNPAHNPGGLREYYALSANGMDCFCIDRHGGSSGVLFMDWSVRKVGVKELWTLKWHRQFETEGAWTRTGGVQPSDWPPWMRHFRDY